ncbi:MAG: cysteine hydrolase [Deltaproteobacteria bacterium]|nr:cysteine hydrolase [Deltaproteobacteria bacterium]MBW2302387.1 cysteine hydrolase [Deltaproteobacteria bacterium]
MESDERPAMLIIDMVKDNFDETKNLPITPLARKLIDPINRLTRAFRKKGWPVVFSTDAFKRQDFIFRGKMKPHSLAGTRGAEVIGELEREVGDLWLPKPRFSAFFQTELDRRLREMGVTMCVLAGITTNFCVLATAMDALSKDFKTVILEDCTAAVTEEIHHNTLGLYRRNALWPLFRIMTSEEWLHSSPLS